CAGWTAPRRDIMKILKIIILVFCGVYALQALADEEHETPAGLHCKKTARKYFEKQWGDGMIPGTEGATAATYSQHANTKLGKCFILIDVKTSQGKKKTVSSHSLVLYDLSEGKEYGSYEEEKSVKSLGKTQRSVACTVNGGKCDSESEFEAMVKPYMQE
ncbi:MAG: hypothetical protein KGI81_04690, partial [Betaproteobacteria bacterium]|nr:hypothetical protein [Betaproteobacteria bacterium]